MFQSLLHLYKKHPNKTPLEDFNTECLAGILKMYPKVKNEFIKFLNLPEDEYIIQTQLRKDLEDDTNCIIDLVLIGKENVCFIENKVHSIEGNKQLEKYGKALENHYPNHHWHLYYVTKFSEPKNQTGTYNKYNFNQFKWFEIAKFLKKYEKENATIHNYLEFLNEHKMAQDNTFKAENFVSMENMLKTIDIAEFHIEQSRNIFNKIFENIGKLDNYNKNFYWDQLKNKNRFCHYKSNVLNTENNSESDIMYEIHFGNLQLMTQIAINENHDEYNQFQKIALTNKEFKLIQYENWGSGIIKTQDLGVYLNDIDSDKKIKDWFESSFIELKEIIEKNPQIDWNIANDEF